VLDRVGRLVAVFSIWGPADRLTEDRFEALGALARETAAEILGS
jgi:DNA-binding IclR family transcriptional regulator